jgi:hypothetical protein
MNTTAKLYTTTAAAQVSRLPRSGCYRHRALVRWIRACEGDAVADRAAVDALDSLSTLLEHLPLTSVAHELAADWVAEARAALVRHLPQIISNNPTEAP